MNRYRTWIPWGLALLIAVGTGFYQRRTGPTWPMRGRVSIDGESHRYRLVRSGTTGEDARVSIPGGWTSGEIRFRRYPTDEEYRTVPMRAVEDGFAGALPSQPPAGKLEYYLALDGPEADRRLPAEGTVIIRYKGAVPAGVLIPHILMMFLAMLLGYRTAFAAITGSRSLPRLVLFTLAFLTVGGMILGPCVQKYAFGEFWTGWPNGKDLTDNKMLLLWVAWLAAAAVVRFAGSGRIRRVAVVAAAVVMIGVFLIPHSARGSQLNYEKLEKGVSPTRAIETG